MAAVERVSSSSGLQLTKQQALQLQDLFISEYDKVDFQKALRQAWSTAGGDAKLQEKARQELCLPVQSRVLERYGFSGSRAGILEALSAFSPHEWDAEVAEKNRILAQLTNPGVADKAEANSNVAAAAPADGLPSSGSRSSAPAAGTAGGQERVRPSGASSGNAGVVDKQTSRIPSLPKDKYGLPDNPPSDGQLWAVVGSGGSHGGIVVRAGKDIHSTQLKSRLQTGARVEEVELVGERLHYRRLRGDGPDFGWVSLSFKGSPLVTKIDLSEL